MSAPQTTRVADGARTVRLRLDVIEYRACQLCNYGRDSKGQRCSYPEAPVGNTVQDMRDIGGPCGPEARWLDYTGLNTPARVNTSI